MFDTQLFWFMSRAKKGKTYNSTYAGFGDDSVEVGLVPQQVWTFYFSPFKLKILCQGSDWRLSALAQVYNSSLPHHSTLEHLHIGDSLDHRQGGDI